VAIYHGCSVGERCVLHSGAVIGADGFGMAREKGRWIKIPQVGAVRIGNDVEIGANTSVDRGALDDTIIEDGVKIDNQVQIAHNCVIGAHTVIAGCSGISGSVTIGRNCMLGGGVGMVGHISLCDNVAISAYTLVTKSITKPGTYTAGMPFMPHAQWLRNAVHLRHLDRIARRAGQEESPGEDRERNDD
jgi:UDP-3-O-[3-hydroxymyristoyl] glucosamine N-acyltransferase